MQIHWDVSYKLASAVGEFYSRTKGCPSINVSKYAQHNLQYKGIC